MNSNNRRQFISAVKHPQTQWIKHILLCFVLMRLWASFHKDFLYLNTAGWICFHLQTAWNMTTTADWWRIQWRIYSNQFCPIFSPGTHFSTSALLIETEFVWFSFELCFFVSFSNFFFSARRQRRTSDVCMASSICMNAAFKVPSTQHLTASLYRTRRSPRSPVLKQSIIKERRSAVYPKWPK